ncbi:YhbP family protein [Conservatibacter flavescens]|uniref:UPF0306 protein CVP05_02590 n=1 Tax=Conservatibacter flavescens TaxID=28161 RepID=A0A2M8S4K5_9PAST|nr:YhbP family protein [Conservatibacter flavescens]PJG86075.1 hypothetical protein CVP05_02590 [Conservatibacter flavescens]
MQSNIVKFLQQKHIVSFSVFADQEMWSAICFYVFDPDTNSLILRTSDETRHGQLMLKNTQVTGTIIHDTETVAKLQGIQFTGVISELKNNEKQTALDRYYARFPYARVMKSPVWHIALQEVKFTDNTLGFGKKTLWTRNNPEQIS